MRLRKLLSVTCFLALITVLAACKHNGSEFLGKWTAKGNADVSKTIEIVQNGDSFLVVHGEDKLPLTYDKESGTMKMGPFQSISYVKTSDTLLLSDGSELQRAK